MDKIDRTILNLMQREASLTNVEMADKVGVSRQTWFKYERGEVFPNAARLDELAAALDVTVSELFEAA